MRKLAVALDCSPMGLYSYFPAKHDLLLALAQRSFVALAANLSSRTVHDPIGALRDMFATLARFGFENPAEYQTMFMTREAQPQGRQKTRQEIYAENPAFALGVNLVQACIDKKALSGDAHVITSVMWTNVHGAISAIMCLPAFPFGKPDQYVDLVIDVTLSGLGVS